MLVKNSFNVVELLYALRTCEVLHNFIMRVFKCTFLNGKKIFYGHMRHASVKHILYKLMGDALIKNIQSRMIFI